MVLFIIYLVVAGVLAYIFKITVGLIFGLPFIIWANKSNLPVDDLLCENPRLFLCIGVVSHAIVGAAYALLICVAGWFFVNNFGGNYWLYFIMSLLWAFTAFGGVSNMIEVFFFAIMPGVVLCWFFGIYPLIALCIVDIIYFIPYFFKQHPHVIAAYDHYKNIKEDSHG